MLLHGSVQQHIVYMLIIKRHGPKHDKAAESRDLDTELAKLKKSYKASSRKVIY